MILASRAIVLALALLTLTPGSEAQAQRVTLDISPAVSRGEPMLAAALRQNLPREIQKSLAGKFSGPLRIRILDAKFMRDPGFGIVDRADYLDGLVIVPGRDPIPIRLTLPFDRSLNAFTLQGQSVRVRNLIEVFAQWIAKYI